MLSRRQNFCSLSTVSPNHSNRPVLIDFVVVAAWTFSFVRLSSCVSFSCKITTWPLSVIGKMTTHSGLMWIVGVETLCSQLLRYYHNHQGFRMLMWYTQCLILLRKVENPLWNIYTWVLCCLVCRSSGDSLSHTDSSKEW